MAKSKLFQPISLGDVTLKHHIVMAALTRFRADNEHVLLPHVLEYYTQRASVPGTLLITEATFIAPQAGGYNNVPGIWSKAQIAMWKQITDALNAENPSLPYVSASDIPSRNRPATEIRPQPLSVREIHEYTELYAAAASNAVHKAGFDGDVSNVRTDQYGGSLENRCKFALEVVDAVVAAVGPNQTGIRLSPWNPEQDMGMQDPKPTFARLVQQTAERHPEFLHIHAVEPRIYATTPRFVVPEGWSNDFLSNIWVSTQSERRFISAGGYTRALAVESAENKDDIIAFGLHLPYRLLHDIPLADYDRKRFYGPSTLDPKGFTDYPFANESFEPLQSRC
ncbi:FMN-linked oxidoreductase [Mycena capillaripes]|nr:FMN-linked oxidoreductase [Mycena capillaripes]